jgi:transposase
MNIQRASRSQQVEKSLEAFSKQELITIIMQQREVIADLQFTVTELQAAVATLQKDSTNSSKPPSSDFKSRKNLNSRKVSGLKSGGQVGHIGTTRRMVKKPDQVVRCEPEVCESCGENLLEIAGRCAASAQVIDLPPIIPEVIEYQQVVKTCGCGHVNKGLLPDEARAGTIQIGNNVSALMVYLNAAHHIPYARLETILSDLLHFPLSQGTINNKLEVAAQSAEGLKTSILERLLGSEWVGSDETGARVAGQRDWQWIWQNDAASLFAISPHRSYQAVKDNFGESYSGTLVHDCYGSQNNTIASAHQLCHAHLLRDLQFLVETENSSWAYQMQELLLRSQRARDAIWESSFNSKLRSRVQDQYQRELDALIEFEIENKAVCKLQKRFKKHSEKILCFMQTPDVPPDNNGSERGIRNARVKQKVSGGYRSQRGAERQAALLSVIETAKKQGLNILETIQGLMTPQPVVLFGAT